MPVIVMFHQYMLIYAKLETAETSVLFIPPVSSRIDKIFNIIGNKRPSVK